MKAWVLIMLIYADGGTEAPPLTYFDTEAQCVASATAISIEVFNKGMVTDYACSETSAPATKQLIESEEKNRELIRQISK